MAIRKLDIKTKDGLCDVTIAHPEGDDKYPSVILLMDAFGPRAYLDEMAVTLASHGYFVLVPNLFYRTMRAPFLTGPFPLTKADMVKAGEIVMPMARAYDANAGLEDIGTFLDFLAQQKSFNGKIGLTGYCMGGSMALRTAAKFSNRISAVASFHAGRLATDAENSPHRVFGEIRAEIYIAHADHDASMPPEQMELVRKTLENSDAVFEAELYRDALHGFTMKDLPAYNEGALERHWSKLLSLFERTMLNSGT